MASDMLADSGLKRQIGLAEYYEALAAFYQDKDEDAGSDKPVKSTAQFKNSELDQLYQIGWTIGMNRGQAILIEARKEIEGVKNKR